MDIRVAAEMTKDRLKWRRIVNTSQKRNKKKIVQIKFPNIISRTFYTVQFYVMG